MDNVHTEAQLHMREVEARLLQDGSAMNALSEQLAASKKEYDSLMWRFAESQDVVKQLKQRNKAIEAQNAELLP